MEFTTRQLEIIKAATILIGEKGVKNLTTKKLAAKIGFSEPAIYRHFKNKTVLLESILLFYKSDLKKTLTTVLNSNTPAIEKIHSILDFQFKHFYKNPAIIMVIFSETSFQHEHLLSKTVTGIMDQKKKMLETILKKGQEENNIRNDIDTAQLATVIMGTMRFTILRWRLTNFEFNLLEEAKILWNTIEKLIAKP